MVRDDIDAIAFQIGLAVVTRPLAASSGDECSGPDAWLVDLCRRFIKGAVGGM